MCGGTLSSSVDSGEVERMVERVGRGEVVVMAENGNRLVNKSRRRRDSVVLSSLKRSIPKKNQKKHESV
jgi:hypothetical protein